MLVLAIDTSHDDCGAALWRGGETLAATSEAIGRGHGERLPAMLDAIVRRTAIAWNDLDRIAVVAGPGSFTGLRVGVAAARGLALALSIPAIGVDGFNLFERQARSLAESLAGPPGATGRLAICFGRPEALMWRMRAGPNAAIGELRRGDRAALLAEAPDLIVGPAAALLEAPPQLAPDDAAARRVDLTALAALAASRPSDAPPPTPLYIRRADAAPAPPPAPRLS